jgi:hypothetical protein
VHQDHSEFVTAAIGLFHKNVDEFIMNGSNYILNGVFKTQIDFARCKSLSGSCGLLSVRSCNDLGRLPNPTSPDNKCFFYAVAQAFTKTESIIDAITFMQNNLVTDNIQTPVKISSIARFEKLNAHLNIRVNVLYEEGGDVFPIFVSSRITGQTVINILLYKTLVAGTAVNHYAYIPDLSPLLRKTYRRPNGGTSYEKTFVCPNCLGKFSREDALTNHFDLCRENRPQRLILPQENEFLKFSNFHRKFKLPVRMNL